MAEYRKENILENSKAKFDLNIPHLGYACTITVDEIYIEKNWVDAG